MDKRADEARTTNRPEVPTTAHWRTAMRKARESQGVSQAELGRRVGVSQNVVSKIETGEQESSEAIVPICRALGIPLPFALFADEIDERWFHAGQMIRKKDQRLFKSMLASMETMALSVAENEDGDA